MRRASLLLIVLFVRALHAHGADDIDMAKVRALANEPVKDILRDSPVHELARASYWKTIRGAKTPVVVLFYSNVDGESQRLATLVRYVAAKYAGRFATYGVLVIDRGKPPKAIATDYEKEYSLDKTPGILFYDRDLRPEPIVLARRPRLAEEAPVTCCRAHGIAPIRDVAISTVRAAKTDTRRALAVEMPTMRNVTASSQ